MKRETYYIEIKGQIYTNQWIAVAEFKGRSRHKKAKAEIRLMRQETPNRRFRLVRVTTTREVVKEGE